MILFGEAGHTNPLCGASEYCNQEIRATPVRRLEICQKIYTTGFSGQKFYPLKVRKLRLFLLKEKQCICIYISYFSSFFVRIQLSLKNFNSFSANSHLVCVNPVVLRK